MSKRKEKGDREEFIEEMFRPSPYLGYSRDALGVHLINCRAYEIAETQFRRAVRVNPFNATFKCHLAWCLYKEKSFSEARDWIEKALKQAPDDEEIRHLSVTIHKNMGEKRVDSNSERRK